MKRPRREIALYSVVFAIIAVLTLFFAVWLKDVIVAFSGALVAFTWLLWIVDRDTLALQKRFDEREHARANPEPIFHDTSRLESHIGFNTDTRVGTLKLVFSVSNPGDRVLLIESVQIIETSIGNPVASQLGWVVRLPILGPSPRGGPYSSQFPAPVFPAGLTEFIAYFKFHDAAMFTAGTALVTFTCSIAYRLGNSDISTPANWTRRG